MHKAAFLAFALSAVALTGCGRQMPPGATDITGTMPALSFTMTRASDGAGISANDYRGKVVVLYFGYTHCPDVCPATLANLTDLLQYLGRDADKVRVLFVTVDPNRDTLPILKQYAAAFAPQVDGLRGSDNELAALARRYRVAYSVDPGPPYTVMHSSAVFFFDAGGRARMVTLSTDDTAALANVVERLVHG
ncbi:MAG: SCO family protein [Alphaproteobacteria bacterium]|nr:SCO family protein [Alphaproteobacteria bacterium]